LLQQLQAGVEAHRRGDLAVAERNYRAVLAHAPETLDATNLLGRLLVQTGRPAEAVSQLRRALDATATQGPLWLSYAEALIAAGEVIAAREAAETARRLLPQEVDALYLWAETQRLGGAWAVAAGGFRRVLTLRPQHAAAALQLATCLQAAGDQAGALAAARQALALAPQAPEVHNNFGNLLAGGGDHAAALASFEQALRLRPLYPAALVNKAGALRDLDRAAEALPIAEAAVQASQALTPPLQAEAWHALGQTRHALGDPELALAAFREALARRPGDAEMLWNYALAALAAGRFAEGWQAYAARWRKAEAPLPRRHWPWPRWSPAAKPDGRLLLWGEQGLGDRLLFLQYLPALLRTGVHVTLETDSRLVPLLRRTFPGLDFAPEGRVAAAELLAQDFAAHLPLGDLPSGPPPGEVWLRADAARAAVLRTRYRDGGDDRLVGLSWRSANPSLGAAKSLRPADLAPLAAMSGCRFVSLQYGATDAELAELRGLFGTRFLLDPEIDAGEDLDGLAAQITALDQVVTVSNVTAHLAGALGRPVWVLAPPAGKSRFFYLMAQGDGTPWYPAMRVFRPGPQAGPAALVEQVAGSLVSLAKCPPR
jgi:tetratricopeptide (TPR) repeat protein